jgi:hypothetical protein
MVHMASFYGPFTNLNEEPMMQRSRHGKNAREMIDKIQSSNNIGSQQPESQKGWSFEPGDRQLQNER